MAFRLGVVTRRAMSWSFVLVPLFVPVQRATAQRAVGIISEQRMGALPDSAQLAAGMAAAIRMQNPAGFALSAQKDLGLSPQQVAALEALLRTATDSQTARMMRMMKGLESAARDTAAVARMQALSSWTGPIDEAGIRASACEQSKMQAEMLIGMMRDRHAVGALLTATQQEALDQLQRDLMMKAYRKDAPNDK